ncbi:30S ribosomal protein S24e [Candidatus Bathyarchaeota archaeon]|jgi:ribosomal protein S24E|nr:30S ribosomal protein S24e [Candidatus Bathyarchaeota archaeon]
MKVEISSKERNPLLKRMEITFKVNHEETGGTPQRFEVRKILAKILNKDIQLMYIKRMETKTGTMTAFGSANIYDSTEQAKLVESKHILQRNIPPEKANGEEQSNE